MEKKDIFSQIEQLEEQMGNVYADLTLLKQTVVLLLEENKKLMIENQQLRKLLKKDTLPEEPPAEGKEAHSIGEGYDNLARLYQEGFHICNVYYGHLRTEGDCLFCMSFFHK